MTTLPARILPHYTRPTPDEIPDLESAGNSSGFSFRVLDLFSGLGGFSLGLERTGGFKTVAFCEIEEFPRRVLAKHWPGVPCYHDVRELTADTLARDGIAVDVICGGFPCQDISTAGRGAGIEGERSGLWSEYARLIRELRPRYVIVENVAALLSRGLDRVLGDLATLGYDAEWHCIPASAVGAPHRRDRVWIVAYGKGEFGNGRNLFAHIGKREVAQSPRRGHRHVPDSQRWSGETQQQGWILEEQSGEGAPARFADGNLPRNRQWSTEPDVGRVANGVPDRAHRLKGLGNAVVPQIPELIGRAILQHHASFAEAAE